MNDTMTRRQVLITGIKAATLVPTSLLFGCGSGKGGTVQPSSPTVGLNGSTVQPISPTSGLDQTISGLDTRLHQELINSGKLASVGGQWSELAFNDLIDSMGEDSLKRTCKTLDISSSSAQDYVSNPIMKKEIKKTIADASGGWFGGDIDKILYHEKVLRPIARSMELDKAKIETYDTLSLERAVYNRVFEQSWTSLNENERIVFLQQSNWNIPQDKAVGLASLTGAGVLAGLSTVVKLSGFSFYVGMSTGLHAIASSMGVVFPFSLYTGASVAISLATSPVGWVAVAILAVAGVYAWAKSNQASKEATMLKTVLHMHHYKISAMQEANITFSVSAI